ncbi:ester cyclase family protein [Streptomyces sp. TX20-6-3]|uniref:ester cyclase family protein n=1 Tax=Streptomyces sp. TX20-6-3 TaxID=3028705 RepID=UPI0029B21317|nr:ester cyclase family protein [Streptomyces sp. TX20-6-3]MDX2561398.1 ester cyclase family protein [Streptomyces sp. TX20-6-3]
MTDTTRSSNAALIKRLYAEVYNVHRLDRMPEFYAKDVLNHGGQGEVGADALRNRVGMMFTAFPDAVAEVEHIVAQNDRVLVFLRWTGHLTGSEEEMTLHTANLYRVRDGEIAEHWSVVDQSGLTRFGMPAADQTQPAGKPDWAATETEQANMRLVLKVWDELMQQHLLDRADEYYRQDYIQHNAFAAQSGGGLKGMKDFFAGLFALAPDLTGEITQIIAQDDLVGVFCVWRGHEQSSGRELLLHTADLLRVQDGLIAEHWDVMDYAAVADFGVAPQNG